MIGNNTNWVKAYIVDVLPCISVAFFILAYIYNAALFSVFDIDILQYATYGDIFISITEPLCIYALFIAIWLPYSYRDYKVYKQSFSDLLKEKKSKNHEIKLPYSWLRFFAKTRKNSIIKIIVNLYNLLWSCLISIIKFINQIVPAILVISIAIMALIGITCENLYFYILDKCSIPPTLSVVAPALILPVIMWPLFISFFIGVFNGLSKNNKQKIYNYLTSFRYKSIPIIAIAFCYYVYAIAIFGETGYRYGENLKTNNDISFTIKTTDGTIFDNNNYGYIAHLSEKTFLFSKKTKENIVLFNDNITYKKVKKIHNGKNTYNIIDSYF
jgi:hypothetical protein